MAKILNSVFQAGIIVEDLEEKVKYYAEELGIGPWKIFRSRDEQGNIRSVFARGWTGGAMNKGFELELFDKDHTYPMYSEFYKKYGAGVIQHLCFGCEDFAATREELMKRFPVLMDSCGRGYDNSHVNCTYFDAVKELGIILEISEYPVGAEEGKVASYRWEEEVYPVKKLV